MGGTLRGMSRRWAEPEVEGAGGAVEWQGWRQGPPRIYKGRGRGPAKALRCCCCFPQSVAGLEISIGGGVRIVLCADHRDPAFLGSRNARDFLAALATLYRSLGLTGRRYGEALLGFVERIREVGVPTPRRRPGSYSWPAARAAAEAVWAAGGAYGAGVAVIDEATATLPVGAIGPSPTTVRRWYHQQRWLLPRPGPTRRPAEHRAPARRRREPLTDRRPTRHRQAPCEMLVRIDNPSHGVRDWRLTTSRPQPDNPTGTHRE